MAETLEKLRPDRDLQCYFERPSAIAAISQASAGGYMVSGTWRQQFDWVVIEWNRDNVFEHPLFRNLPDGDLSGLVLTYEETRNNCLPLDSDIYPTVDWPYLRVWASGENGEELYLVPIRENATPVEGAYSPAQAEFELLGTVTGGDYVGIAWPGEHHTHQAYGTDTIPSIVSAIVTSINSTSPVVRADQDGARLRLYYVGPGQTLENSTAGANGNRFGAYTFTKGASGTATEFWQPQWQKFSGGASPTKWRIRLDFRLLRDKDGRLAPTNRIRKMRWTYAADLQPGAFQRSEFAVNVSNWTVEGAGRGYVVAAPASQRIEEGDSRFGYSGAWTTARGNFSGGSIRHTDSPGASAVCSYHAPQDHALYLGTRRAPAAAVITVSVDGGPAATADLHLPGEDVLVRLLVGSYGAGPHTVSVTHAGSAGTSLYIDYLEAAVPATELPACREAPDYTLATDWDTDHSIALAPERTAWMIDSLGFRGRANHYVGALWFYELIRDGHEYAMATIDFIAPPVMSQITEILIGRVGEPPESRTVLQHLNTAGDTQETLARAFELEMNRGYTAIRAVADGARLYVFSRAMGAAGNDITIEVNPSASVQVSGPTLAGGTDGEWRTDLAATPRLNRAVRDWSRSYYAALKSRGIDVTAAFSMELQHGDPSEAAGIAQRYPDGAAALLNTPALQTNFGPASRAFWKQVYAEMADLLAETGHQPFLQFGEVQWWYFPNGSGMPLYDTYTRDRFFSEHSREMRVAATNNEDPALFADELDLWSRLIGEFTNEVMAHVRAAHPGCRFEVLYPPDVNETAFNRLLNYPDGHWTPAALDCLKTESFTYTYLRNLDLSRESIEFSKNKGFPRSKRAHLVGIADSTTAWAKEARLARGEVQAVVLFALDQFCLAGYGLPVDRGLRRAVRLGWA